MAEEKSAKRKESFKSIKTKKDSEKSQDKLLGNSIEFTGDSSPLNGTSRNNFSNMTKYKPLKMKTSDQSTSR